MEANEKDMRKRGIPSLTELLTSIRKMLAEHIEESRQNLENGQQNQRQTNGLPRFPKCKAISKQIKSLWHKIPDGWYKNPYAWTGIEATLIFVTLFVVSWMQWHRYREENIRFRAVADKYKVATIMLNELYSELAVTVGAYEKLVETVGVDSTLTIFKEQVKAVRKETKNRNK